MRPRALVGLKKEAELINDDQDELACDEMAACDPWLTGAAVGEAGAGEWDVLHGSGDDGEDGDGGDRGESEGSGDAEWDEVMAEARAGSSGAQSRREAPT